jgi:exosortase/archaeosortase family protein
MYGFHFFIYGNLGKLVIFSTLVFLLLSRGKLQALRVQPLSWTNALFFLGGGLLIPLFFSLSNILLTHYKSFADNLMLSLLTHGVLIAIPLFFFLGSFGIACVKSLISHFYRELLICLGLSLVLFVAIFQVWKLWPLLSNLVLQCEYFIFSHIYDTVYIIHPRGLFVNTFAVEIEEACSGLESIFLFSLLYLVICLIDWKKLNKRKIVLLFPFLVLSLVAVNIVRVFLLILVGVLINPHIMTVLFHTYLGLLLFVVYFILFMKVGYPWLQKNAS